MIMISQITSCFENHDHVFPEKHRVFKITILFGQSRSFSENHNIICRNNDCDLKITTLFAAKNIMILKSRCFLGKT